MNKRESRKVMPAVNIVENEKEIVLEAEIAGLKKDEVGIDVTGETLVIKGKRKESTEPDGYELVYSERCDYEYERAFILGNEVDKEKIKAKYDNGILKVTLPKTEDTQPKKISIE